VAKFCCISVLSKSGKIHGHSFVLLLLQIILKSLTDVTYEPLYCLFVNLTAECEKSLILLHVSY